MRAGTGRASRNAILLNEGEVKRLEAEVIGG